MEDTRLLKELVRHAKECAKHQPGDRQPIEQFHSDLRLVFKKVFIRIEKPLSEESYIKKQRALQYSTFSLSIVVERRKFTRCEVQELLRSVFDAICSIKVDAPLAKSFDKIIFVILLAASKLDHDDYQNVVRDVVDVFKYCQPSTCKTTKEYPILFSPTVISGGSDVFNSIVADNVLAAFLISDLPCPNYFNLLWPHCRKVLNNPDKSSKFSLKLENCFKIGIKVLKAKKSIASIVEQAKLINEFFMIFESSRHLEPLLKSVLYQLFELIQNFVEEQGKLLIIKKELRESTLIWLKIYISSIAEDDDEFGLLETFAKWLFDLSDNSEVQEVSAMLCVDSIGICVERISILLTSTNPDALTNYLDILASLCKLSKIHGDSHWNSISAEIQKHASLENPRWPRLLAAILNARNSSCFQVFRKFAHPMDALWSKIQNEDSSRQTVYSVAFILATCPGYDEGGRQLLPMLILPCFQDLREYVGTKRDSFRFVGGGRGTPNELRDLEKYAQMLDYKNSESVKLRAVSSALLIEKKTTSYVGLIVDLAVSVFTKAKTNKITICLPALSLFLTEQPSYINEFLGCLTTKLCQNLTVYSEETVAKLCKSVRNLICYSCNRRNQCSKCEKNQKSFVKPDPFENIRIDERSLTLFIKGVMENYQKYSNETISAVLEMCRAILIHHADSNKLPSAFTSVVKAFTLAFGENASVYFRVWELISARSKANDEKKLQIYVPVLSRTFFSLVSTKPQDFDSFMEKLFEAKLSKTVKVTVIAAFFSHAVATDSVDNWNVFSNCIRRFARVIIEKCDNLTGEEMLQAIVKRYSTVFTRSFLARSFFDSYSATDHFDELKTREAVRSFVSNVMIHFKFPNLISTLLVLRPTLLYWSLVSGARGQNSKHVLAVIDFLCQELIVASTSTSNPISILNDIHTVIAQRKALITEMFQHIVQLWAFESCKGNDALWSFCQEHCGFTEHDMKSAISSYRKGVFERLVLVSPEVFLNPSEGSVVVLQLQKTYENLKKGEKFTLTTAMDTRREGTEFIFSFRSYFTDDVHFWMRERAVAAFRVVLQHVKPDFLDTNWWTILSTLRQCPNNLDSIRLAWIQFVETLNYNILRTNIWRILTDLARVENNLTIIEAIWNRVRYANEIEKIANDDMMRRIFWIIPLEVEKRVDFDFTIAKSRRIDDVFEFIRQFPRYPSLHFVDNLSSKIERGTVWKDDLPKLMGAITGILPACQSDFQRNQVCSILQKVPIYNSESADQVFSRWGTSSSSFFAEPIQLTQAVLEECGIVVETMSAEGKLAYADRTMCEIQKFFNDSVADLESRSSLMGLRDMYSTMNCQKPEPPLIDFSSADDLIATCSSPTQWFTLLIMECAQKVAIDSPLSSLIPIAHINDQRFLAKLSMRFILTVIYKGMEAVAQWILTLFENTLSNATHRQVSKTERAAAVFIFYVFDFLYYYLNSEEVRKKKTVWDSVYNFWKSMLEWTIRDEHGHEQPLVVRVASSFGMEKRCILWMELYMEQLTRSKKKDERIESEKETAYYFTLMKLYARMHELNGVRGAFARLSKAHIGHVYGRICMKEAFGEVAAAATLSKMTGKGKPFDPMEEIQKLIAEHENSEPSANELEDQEEQIEALKSLTKWVQADQNIGPSPQVFSRTIEFRAMESKILAMIQDGADDEIVDSVIEKTRMKTIEKISECALGGYCSYETATPLLVQIHQLDEICRFKNASIESLAGVEQEFWRSLNKKTNETDQRMDVLEPILRVRRSMLTMSMKKVGDYKDEIRSKIVESHLQSARIARLTGCLERAQLAIINAKKVMPFDNRIVLEEAKLQLQSSDELSGMNLLDSIIDKTFGELSKHYGDTQQSRNLDLQKTARSMIEMCPAETKNLFSSVQMLRISHMIKAGNTIGFEKIYNETTNLLHSFVSSGVMYEAAWLLDYLFHHNERNRHVLPLLKAYTEVAKFETNPVLQARAVERMTSLWLSNTKKLKGLISSSKVSANAAPDMIGNIKTMNREIINALDRIGLCAFYPAYAVLARHIDHPDEDVFRTIKNVMQQLIFRMPHQCMWQSVYLLRQDIAEVKNRYMDILTSVKRKSPVLTTLIDQYDYASAVFNLVPGKVDSDKCNLSEKVDGLRLLFRENKYDAKELVIDRRIEGECKVICGIMVPVRSEIDGSVLAMETPESFEDSCIIPDRYLIHDFSDKVKVLHSKTKPVLIELITKAGRKVRLICKKEDDLTKDYHFTKMVEMCNDLLIKDEQTRIQNMAATTYSVIPLAKHGGIIEFMDGVSSYYETLEKHMGRTESEWMGQIKKWAAQMKTLSKEKKAEYFRNEMCEKSPLVMAKWFRSEYPEAGKWFASRKLFAKSSAVMSMIGYIFGLGDRHTKNLMVHVPTGKCVHVDFDMIFNKGELLEVPEVVPFRLTRNMINGMGEVALDGEFRTVCEQTLRVFRENSYQIEKYIADLPNLVSEFVKLKDFDMTEAKRLISGRLRGQIMTAKIYKSNPISHPMQVSQLASSLIELATSDEKLCEMFEGWMPTL